MTKELEALKNIKHYDSRVGLHEDDYVIIEKALKEYENLQEVKRIIVNEKTYDMSEYGKKLFIVDTKSQKVEALKDEETEKKLKTFEVIKSYISVYKDDNGICWLSMMGDAIGIPHEEYDVLKEVLL